MKKNISASLYQKCLILCSKILLNVLHSLSLTVLLPWQHTGFQTSSILKPFLATLVIPFSYLRMVPHIHDPTNTQICQFELWSCLTFFELKITNIFKLSGWGLEKSEMPQEKCLQPQVCFLKNYQPTKFQWSALQIGQDSLFIHCNIGLSV